MTVLDRLLGRRRPADPTPPDAASADASSTARGDAASDASSNASGVECAHVAVTPRWDRVEDMGHEERATSFVCDSCHATLTPDEARRALRDIGNRLRLD
ncbi:MAG: hypothetical protein WC273_06915 [Dehalococcoidia bacterium]